MPLVRSSNVPGCGIGDQPAFCRCTMKEMDVPKVWDRHSFEYMTHWWGSLPALPTIPSLTNRWHSPPRHREFQIPKTLPGLLNVFQQEAHTNIEVSQTFLEIVRGSINKSNKTYSSAWA